MAEKSTTVDDVVNNFERCAQTIIEAGKEFGGAYWGKLYKGADMFASNIREMPAESGIALLKRMREIYQSNIKEMPAEASNLFRDLYNSILIRLIKTTRESNPKVYETAMTMELSIK